MNILDLLLALRPWVLLSVLGLLIICFFRANIKREEAYSRMRHMGRLQDLVEYEKADTRFVGVTIVLISYATLGMVLQLIPFPFW